jgi:hypothetical protein
MWLLCPIKLYKLANELDKIIGNGELAEFYLYGYIKMEVDEKKGKELIEEGIKYNDMNCKDVLATYLRFKDEEKESIKLFEELIESKYYPSYSQYGKNLMNTIKTSEDPGGDKLRGKKLILEAANEGEDRDAIIYLLNDEKFKKEYQEKYLNLKFLENEYFKIKYENSENDLDQKIKFFKKGIKFNSEFCVNQLASIY